ncbi:MAG: TatD family hydrolase [Alphaproteobacteria bacterium]|nr:MAG: TatD family hydrolase [Alphaproteobacteria bacterium]
MFADSHCHLDFPELAEQRQDVLKRARAAGVQRFLTIATHYSRHAGVQAIADQEADVWCSVGVHPHHCAEAGESPSAQDLLTLTRHPRVAAIGETGLDYHYEHSPRQVQQESFRRHIHVARETGLPIIVHTREADDDTAHILKQEGGNDLQGVLHCFSSGRDLAMAALEMGFYISCSGILTFRNAQALREIIRDIPLDRLLIETDAPFLAPIPHRGRVNEPGYVIHTAASLAELKGVPLAELASATTANFLKLFSRVDAL